MYNKKYHKWTTYRRKLLDLLQEKYKNLYYGIVLDIGGRDRGIFQKPREKVNNWIFADINEEYKPDIILDVSNMSQIENNSIDVINAMELFEHVKHVKKGLQECYRVLKKKGLMFLSVPFLFPIHSDPYDYQRWTNDKWKFELQNIGFKIKKFIIMGKYFMHLAETIQNGLKSIRGGTIISYFLLRILDLLVYFDFKPKFRNNQVLNSYHCGYFMIIKKK